MTSPETDVEIAVIGAGLSGLASALLLSEAGKPVRVLEARGQPGGRIRSVFDRATGSYLADLGPTWIWPAYQPVIGRWIDRLELRTFPQFDAGNAVLDHGPGTPPEMRFLPGQEGNVRVAGGPQAIVDALAARLPRDTLVTDASVTSVSCTAEGMEVRIAGGAALRCERVIVAVPPRIAVNTITWSPDLPAHLRAALAATPTWMAPHAKVAAIYDTPFWRDRGLSGRIASRTGPIVEGHDHCGPDGSPAALFGFVGWPHDARAQAGADLTAQVHAQLMRCFGADSPAPLSIHIEDWARDPHVTSPDDLAGPMQHPSVGPDVLRMPHADGRLWFAGAETAARSPGLIEGAFDAAEQVVANLGGYKPVFAAENA